MVCKMCGEELPDGATMCDMCGTDLVSGGAAPVPVTAEERFQQTLKAAGQGDKFAQYDLGVAYRDGNGTAKDTAKAIEWFGKAAEQGKDGAANALAQLTSKPGDVLETLTAGDGIVQLAYAEGDEVGDEVSIYVQNGCYCLNSKAGIVHYLVKDGEQVKAGQPVAQILRKEDKPSAAAVQPQFQTSANTNRLDDILAELDALTGLTAVKTEMKKLADMLKVQAEMAKKGLKGNISVHFVFTGNPGTGKTTVARILGRLCEAIGLLPSGKVVDTDRSGLVAGYAGMTAPKVNAKCDEAMGGILFIDDAYTLGGRDGHSDPFAQEAVNTLLQRIENDRGKFIVIASGYKDDMEKWLQSSPGLASRFSQTINFEDYNPDELFSIFTYCVKYQEYTLSAEAAQKAKLVIKDIYDKRGKNFANGREMRMLCEKAIRRMAERSAGATTLMPEDIAE